MTMPELNSPSPRAMQRVNIQNNLAQRKYLTQVTQYERERALAFSIIDHDRLDVKDFLRNLKRCDSDLTPEAQRWLGNGISTRKGGHRLRTAKTAPANFRDTSPVHQVIRNVATAPLERNMAKVVIDEDRTVNKGDEDKGNSRNQPEASGHLRVYGAPPSTQTRNAINPFARRNTYARLAFEETENQEVRLSVPTPSHDQEHDVIDEVKKAQQKDSKTEANDHDVKNNEKGNNQRQTSSKGDGHRGEAATERAVSVSVRMDNASIMREVLDRKQVSRSRRRRRRTPIEDRIQAFYTRLEDMKEMQRREQEAAISKANRRRWILLTQGIDAALADSSDDDDEEETQKPTPNRNQFFSNVH